MSPTVGSLVIPAAVAVYFTLYITRQRIAGMEN